MKPFIPLPWRSDRRVFIACLLLVSLGVVAVIATLAVSAARNEKRSVNPGSLSVSAPPAKVGPSISAVKSHSPSGPFRRAGTPVEALLSVSDDRSKETLGFLSPATINYSVAVGGTLDIAPLSSIIPAAPPGMDRMEVTIPTVSTAGFVNHGTIYRVQLLNPIPWGTGPPNAFEPGSPNNRVFGGEGFRYTNNGTGAGTSETIPVTFRDATGFNTLSTSIVIAIDASLVPPTITTQPDPLIRIPSGSTATMTVVGSDNGHPPLTYQWYEGFSPVGTLIPGATNASYTTPVLTVIEQKHYFVRLSSPGGSVDSNGVTVQVETPTTVTASNAFTIYGSANHNINLFASATAVGVVPLNQGAVQYKSFPLSIILAQSGTVGNGFAPPTSVTIPGGSVVGVYPFQAQFIGPSGFADSPIDNKTITIDPAPTITTATTTFVFASASPQVKTLNATVTSQFGPVGEGTVTFTVKRGATTVGSPVTSATVSNNNASADFTVPASTVGGALTIQAVYNPSTNYLTSSDSAHTLFVDPVITPNTARIPQSATTLVINGLGFDPVTPGNNVVNFANGTGTVTAATFTQLTVTGITGLVAGPLNASVTTNGATSQTVEVANVVAPPTISKAFGAASVPLNGSTTLTFTIINPFGNTLGQTGIAFSDTLPAGLIVATPNNGLSGTCGAGTITAVAGSGSISLSGGTLTAPPTAGSVCTFLVNVTEITAGTQNNTTGTISSTEGATGTTSNTATVDVLAPPTISNAFGAANIRPNTSTSLSFTLTNPPANQLPLTGVAFSDTLPTGLTVANSSATVCGGTLTTTAPTGIALTGASVNTNSQCQFSVTVTGAASGNYTNTTGNVTSTNGGTGLTASANLTVASPPTISKGFNPTSIALNTNSALSFTITNPNTNVALSGVAFTDTLPAGLTVADSSSTTCSGTLTTTASSRLISLSGASIGTGGSNTCQFSVTVTGAALGNYTNTTGPVSSTNGGTGNTASANLRVVCITSFIVNDNGDADDATPGDGICATSGGVCTLRAAIQEANAGSSCDFAINFSLSTPNTITLNTGLPDIAHNVSINGPGVNLLTVQRSTAGGTPQFRISTISVGTTVNISGLTISNGSISGAIGGGAIYNDRGTLTVTNCAFSQNSAETGGAIFNSGIFGTPTLTIINSTFSQNSATSGFGQGGAIYSIANSGTATLNVVNSTFTQNSAKQGGALFNVATDASGTANLNVVNSTFSQNSGSTDGGGVTNEGTSSGTATAQVTNTTFGQNSSPAGGGIFNFINSGTAILQIGNTILKQGASGANLLNNGTVTSLGHNLSDDSAEGGAGTGPGGDLNQTGDQRNTDPLLGALASNGGPTQTYLLLPGSPAIDAGSNALAVDQNSNPLTTDQRGAGFPRIINSTVDIGAVEVKANQTITFGALSNKNFGDAPFTVNATASSGLAVSFQILSGPATISGNTVTITGAGTVTVRASQAGDGNFNAATPVDQPFTVAKASQTITFGALANKTFGDADFTVSASASSGLAVSFSASGQCTVTGAGTVHLTAPGSCTITAKQAGNANFNAATDVPQTFSIANAVTTTAVISSLNPSALSQNVTFTATVTSAVTGTPTGTVQFKDGVTNLGSPQTLNVSAQASIATTSLTAGSHVITAVYSGDAVYATSTGTLSGGQFVNDKPVISFSQSTYNTSETAGFVTVTVNRTGLTGPAVTVDYATDDTGAPTSCAQTNGLASARCDFTTALGTLKFAAGETQKTFVVLINRDSYVEGPESFTVNLSNPTGGAILATPSTATVTIADDSSGLPPNAVDDAQFFVQQHYHDFLNREPDAAGLAFWTNQITSCGADQQCIAVKRINVSAAFFLSIEFQQTGYFVERSYKVSYGDATGTSTLNGTHSLPVPIVRFNEFLHDTLEIGQGVVVNQGNWQQQLENNKQAFTAEFVQRSRFATAFPTTLTPAQFVDMLFTNAGVTPAASDRTAAINEFGAATTTSDPAARARALRDVAENSTLTQQETNRAFVLMQYFGYVRRNPNDPQDTDYTGYDFWLTKLNQFNGNFQNAEMVKAFISSGEYRHRFGP